MSRLAVSAAILLGMVSAAGGGFAGAQDEPPLPVIVSDEQDEGPPLPVIGGEEEPGLPAMPEIGPGAEEPALPAMPEMGAAEPVVSAAQGFSERLDAQLGRLPVPLHGFLEMRAGARLTDDPDVSRDFTLGETRLQLKSDPFYRGVQFTFKADALYDLVVEESHLDLREANAAFSPFSFADVKVGRQILTWGTGDLLFVNDLFPKDYVSFFIGRDVEYLKAPSDAVKLSLFSDAANLDVVYTPHFDPDVIVTGKRLSYYNPMLGGRAGDDTRIRADEPERWFRDDELALLLYRNVGGYELAAYGYRGFWKSPAGTDPATGRMTYPRLDAYGASVRGRVGKGIGNLEAGYYDSREDRGGDDAFVRNSEVRFLAGYSQDMPRIASDFTVGVQYYLEHMLNYGSYRRSLPPGMPRADETRHVLTLRLTKLLMNQDLRLELFTFYSPSDDDVYLRPHVSYDVTDRLRVDAGANVFIGDEDHTQFGQFERDSNVYVGLRCSF